MYIDSNEPSSANSPVTHRAGTKYATPVSMEQFYNHYLSQNSQPQHKRSKRAKVPITPSAIEKMYKSEVGWRKQKKGLSRLDKICVDLIGPVGCKEWLHDDLNFISDVMDKKRGNIK